MQPNAQLLRQNVQTSQDRLLGISHAIHAVPELAFEEVHASNQCVDYLDELGFSVETGVADLPTSFRATYGDGDLVVGICAEYDALPGIGHACGHNIIAAAALGAAAALRPVVDDLGLTVVVLGTPAEERGGGKVLMLERGAFDGLHASFMVHPAPVDVANSQSLAMQQFAVRYTGRAAHASASPHLGINAADAMTVAQVGIGLLRQHLTRSDQVHGIVTAAGDAANVVPASATAEFCVRSRTVERVARLEERVSCCFEAGAIATGCSVEIDRDPPYADLTVDGELTELYRSVAVEVGRQPVDRGEGKSAVVGSTDMGNISQVMPTIHPMVGIDSRGAVNHQADFTAACVTASADEAVLDGAAMLATTIAHAATQEVRSRLVGSGGYRR